jgi:hypothetical protein
MFSRVARVCAVVALVSATGCRSRGARPDETRPPSVTPSGLVRAPAAQLSAPAPAVRIAIRAEAIDLDQVELFRAWPEPQRRRLAEGLEPSWAESLPLTYVGIIPLVAHRILASELRGGGAGFAVLRLDERLATMREIDTRYRAIAGGPNATDANVYVHRDTPARTLLQVVYTLGQRGYQTPKLVVETARGPGVLPISLDDSPGWTVRVEARGVSLQTPAAEGGGLPTPTPWFGGDCATAGPGPTIPAAAPGVSPTALRACVRLLRARGLAPARARRIIVAPDRDITAEALVGVVVAMREGREGACLEAGSADCWYPGFGLSVVP